MNFRYHGLLLAYIQDTSVSAASNVAANPPSDPMDGFRIELSNKQCSLYMFGFESTPGLNEAVLLQALSTGDFRKPCFTAPEIAEGATAVAYAAQDGSNTSFFCYDEDPAGRNVAYFAKYMVDADGLAFLSAPSSPIDKTAFTQEPQLYPEGHGLCAAIQTKIEFFQGSLTGKSESAPVLAKTGDVGSVQVADQSTGPMRSLVLFEHMPLPESRDDKPGQTIRVENQKCSVQFYGVETQDGRPLSHADIDSLGAAFRVPCLEPVDAPVDETTSQVKNVFVFKKKGGGRERDFIIFCLDGEKQSSSGLRNIFG